MAKILWIWKEEHTYTEWFDVVYDSGRMFTYTERMLPKTARSFIASANAKEIVFKRTARNPANAGKEKEDRKTIYYKDTSEMPDLLIKRINEA